MDACSGDIVFRVAFHRAQMALAATFEICVDLGGSGVPTSLRCTLRSYDQGKYSKGTGELMNIN